MPGRNDPLCATPSTTESGIAGFTSGVASVAFTYPLYKLMFRQMREGVSTTTSYGQLKREGVGFLFRGIGPPLYIKGISTGLMFATKRLYTTTLAAQFPDAGPRAITLGSAVMAGLTEGSICAPLERVQTLLMDKEYNKHPSLKNTPRSMYYLARNYGIKELYRGGSTILFRNVLGCVMYFPATETANDVLPPIQQDRVLEKYSRDFLIGGVIGGTCSSIYYPLNVIKIQMQSVMGGEFVPATRVMGEVYRERGQRIAALYRGVHLNFFRSFFSWAVITATNEFVKQELWKRRCDEE